MKRWFLSLAALATASLGLWDGAALAADTVGVVLMHGKAGTPEHVRSLADELTAAGHVVVIPEMPWSKARAYDASLTDAHAEIDGAIATVKEMGATRVVLAGHSMGANMAMGYAATHPGLAAVMAIGPGQTVEAATFRDALGASIARARTLIAEGRGDEPAVFADLHLGKVGTAHSTAGIYLSYFDPDGLANMPNTARAITTPFLWIVGTRDKNMLDRGRAYAFDRVPANPLNRYAEVPADHMGTPAASGAVILDWLAAVFPRAGAPRG